MKIKYETVNTSTVAGLERAEVLHDEGWIIGSVGLYTIQFYKREKTDAKKNDVD